MWRGSHTCLKRSCLLAASMRISEGAIPASRWRLLVLVGLRQPVIKRQLSFKTGSKWHAWAERSQTGKAYSEAEKDSDKAVVRKTGGDAPHFDVVSFLKMLSRVDTLALVLVTCSLNVKLQSSVAPRYTGLSQCWSCCPSQMMLRFLLANLFLRWNSSIFKL